ncbi:MAG: glycine cleavage T C-terminal barrel domain-containing protein [Actinomycetota bacterium]
MDLIVDSQVIDAREGDDVLTALARAGRWPGGCLCLQGDCPHCLATIDGVAYRRMCRTGVRPGMVVAPFPVSEPPELPDSRSQGSARHLHRSSDVVVIGGGSDGREEAERLRTAGRHVEMLDETGGQEVLAVYPGPEVVMREEDAVVRLRASQVVVATGRTEIQPVAPGNHLAGILTPRAAERLASSGVELGRVAAVGAPAPAGIDAYPAEGTLVRFEGRERVEAVVVADTDGHEIRHDCDSVIVDLGTYPRDVLARMAGGQARTVGGASLEATIPPCPQAGAVCPCSGVTVEDLNLVWEHGFQELELIKRATLAGTGTCQGAVCTPHLRSFVADRGGELQPTFTARPLARPMTIGEAAAGVRLPPIHRTGLDRVHRDLGARMDRVGGWWRPWTYGDDQAEYEAVREAVSLGDVGTLGKILVRGPDAAGFLERLYPSRISDLAVGRSRYALMLAESGGVLDDGLVSRLDDTTFTLTFTTGGASMAEAWLRDWASAFEADVRIMDRTHSLGAINVTGPHASRLLERAGVREPPPFMRHAAGEVGGVPCRVFRLSFTGEVSYELHHPFSRSGELWGQLMRLGADLGIRPHGLRTLLTLRLEKGHIIVGMDTEPDSTPRRLGMEWAVAAHKGDFVGRAALERTGSLPPDRRLVGMTMDHVPTDGAPVHRDGTIVGYVTSAAWSPALGTAVMLAWVDLEEGGLPTSLTVEGRPVRPAATPFYDPEGSRARA